MYINFDTEEIRKIGNSMISICNEFNEVINTMTNRLVKVPNETGEWTGESSEKFFQDINNTDRIKFKNFENEMRIYSQNMKRNAELIETAIDKCRLD